MAKFILKHHDVLILEVSYWYYEIEVEERQAAESVAGFRINVQKFKNNQISISFTTSVLQKRNQIQGIQKNRSGNALWFNKILSDCNGPRTLYFNFCSDTLFMIILL